MRLSKESDMANRVFKKYVGVDRLKTHGKDSGKTSYIAGNW